MKDNQLPTDTEIDVNSLPKSILGKSNNNSVSGNTHSFITKKYFFWIVIFIFSLTISFLIGILLGKNNSTKREEAQVYTLTKPEGKLPISLEVLQNPMLTEWSGRIKGRVKNILSNKIELTAVKEEFTSDGKRIIKESTNPNTISILNVTGFTEFYTIVQNEADSEGKTSKILKSFNDISIGDIIEGSVKIAYNDRLKTFDLIGNTLSIRKSNNE